MVNSRQLEAFRAVMRTGAMTAAADLISISQPAVSRLIRDLEITLGLQLFERRGNLVSPTPQARALIQEVDRAFIGLTQIRDFAEDLRQGRGGVLRLAAHPAFAAGFFPAFAAEYARSRPSLRMIVDGLPSTVIRDRVAAGHFDLGLVAYPFQRAELEAVPFEDPAVIALPLGHPLAARSTVDATDLADCDLVTLTRFTLGQHPLQHALQNVPYRSVIETPLSTIACHFVMAGHHVAIIDRFSACTFADRLVIRPFTPHCLVGSALIQARARPLSTAALEFRTAFLDHVARFLATAPDPTAPNPTAPELAPPKPAKQRRHARAS